MSNPSIIKFLDPNQGEAVAILRSGKGNIGIALSLALNGDTEVFMPVADAEKFAEELTKIINTVKSEK